MNLLWLYFDNGIDENGNKKTFKGIEPNENGYRFDNRFNVKFDKVNKIIYIDDNPKYVKLYNKAISNFSCIVGKNGSGKTTFFEIIITNVSWGMNSYQPEFLISLYYEIEDLDPKFFIQLYKDNAKRKEYKVIYKNKLIDYSIKNNYRKFEEDKTNMIPDNTRYIFHSLSPFYKIFYSIALPLKDNEKRIKYFKEQMDYIGVQKMFSDDFPYEIKVISNFILMFQQEYFRTSFLKALNFEFSHMNIKINDNYFEQILRKNDILFEEIDSVLEKLNNYEKIEKYKNLSEFVLLETKLQRKFFNFFFDNLHYIDDNYEKLKWLFLLGNIDFNKFVNNRFMHNIDNFLDILNFKDCVKDNNIDFECLSRNFLSINYERRRFLNKDIYEWYEKLKKINIFDFIEKNILEMEKNKLEEFLRLVKYLKNRELIEFEIFLKKDNELINYFYLSSGEKTLISYFANIVNSIYKFKPLKDKTFIILIDEVELHLHPEWQRRFINYMNNFFRENKLNVKYQFIIATHSPFILSDIVDEQIIYIKEKSDLKINTFGANIYDIFEKGFFLENSIGKYSEEMIKVIDLILSFYHGLKLAKKNENNIFPLRNLLNKWYISKNGELSEKEMKEQDKELFSKSKKNLLKELFENKGLEYEKFKFLIDDEYNLKPEIENYIKIIGDEVVRNHLMNLYKSLKNES